jgi:hypothetical protein
MQLCCADADGMHRPVHVLDNLFVICTMTIADRSLALEPSLGAPWPEYVVTKGQMEPDVARAIEQRLERLNSTISADSRLANAAMFPSVHTDIVIDRRDVPKRLMVDTTFTNVFGWGWHREQTLRRGYVYQLYADLRDLFTVRGGVKGRAMPAAGWQQQRSVQTSPRPPALGLATSTTAHCPHLGTVNRWGGWLIVGCCRGRQRLPRATC